jgi:glycosyltransferase involved in cell wall biosynthesis
MLVSACAQRKDNSIPLVLAGQADCNAFQQLPTGAIRGLRILGHISDNELKALYENARLFLFPSLTEGFGFPVLEAMSCGCPVIASTAGAIPEIAGEAAVPCDPRDQAAWTRTIDALQDDARQLADLSVRGRVRASQFTWRRAAQKIVSILSEDHLELA